MTAATIGAGIWTVAAFSYFDTPPIQSLTFLAAHQTGTYPEQGPAGRREANQVVRQATSRPGAPGEASIAQRTLGQRHAAGTSDNRSTAPLNDGIRAVATTRLQLGAFGDAKAAEKAWDLLSASEPALRPHDHVVMPAAIGGRKLFRLQVPTSGRAEASDLCGRLKATGSDCFVAIGPVGFAIKPLLGRNSSSGSSTPEPEALRP